MNLSGKQKKVISDAGVEAEMELMSSLAMSPIPDSEKELIASRAFTFYRNKRMAPLIMQKKQELKSRLEKNKLVRLEIKNKKDLED